MFNISILTIGDEICIGQITNTNASWLANQCTALGANVVIHSSIGDVKEVIINELNRLLAFSDFVIITGGLGPTHDDLTKPTLCEFFNDKLLLNDESLKNIEDIFIRRGYRLTERNKAQAMLPSKCTPLINKMGTAPGMLFEENGKYVVSLPGVPNEMKFIMQNSVLILIERIIKEKEHSVVLFKSLLTTGIPESMLADLIGKPEEFMEGGTLAFLPSYSGVKLRIGCEGNNFSEAEAKIKKIEELIRSRAGKYIYGEDNESIASQVGKLLVRKNQTLAVAESCTGGLLGGELTEIPGSSAYFVGGMITYSNEAKINELGVNKKTIEDFGAVSKETAEEMAVNVRYKFHSDYGVSITGIAGPDGGTEEKPLGTVCIAVSMNEKVVSHKFVFSVDRTINRQRAVATALAMLLGEIT